MEPRICIATAFYHSPGRAPNAFSFGERSKFRNYYRCMVVFFASARRAYPQARLMLFSDRQAPAPYADQLSSLGVRTRSVPARYVVDAVLKSLHPGCLYTLDVISALEPDLIDGCDALFLLDSDCVALRRFDAAVSAVAAGRKQIAAYELPCPVGFAQAGHSPASLTLMLAEHLGRNACNPVRYLGGEFYGIPMARVPALKSRIESLWRWLRGEAIRRYGDAITEEHVLTVILNSLPETWFEAGDSTIKRIWTAPHYRTVDGSEPKYSIWHLPSEKKRGFARLYRRWVRQGGWDRLSDEQFARMVAQEVVLFPGPLHRTLDFCRGRAGASFKALLYGA